MKKNLFIITIMTVFLLGLLPFHLYAAEVPDGPSKKTPAPKEEIIQLLQEKDENTGTKVKRKDTSSVQPENKKMAKLKEEDDTYKIYFKKHSHALGSDAKKALDQVAVWLKDNSNFALLIEGHGNEYKSSERNLMLGELRGGSVLSYLVKQGISQKRLTVVSYGSERSRDWRNRKKFGVMNWRVCLLVKEPWEDKPEPEPPIRTKSNDGASVKGLGLAKKSDEDLLIKEAKVFFEKFVRLQNNFDSRFLDLYLNSAKIKSIYVAPNGEETIINLTWGEMRHLVLSSFNELKTKQNGLSEFSDVKYTVEGRKVWITATRHSLLTGMYNLHKMLISKQSNRVWRIEQEISESMPYKKKSEDKKAEDKKAVVPETKPIKPEKVKSPIKPEKEVKKTVAKEKSRDKKPVVSKTQTTSSVQGKQTAKTKRVAIPKQGWEITFDAPSILEQYDNSGKSGYQYLGTAEGGFNISIFVENNQNSNTGNMSVYEYYWPLAKRNPLIDKNSIKMSKHDKFIQVEYVIKGENKKLGKFEMPHINYYFEFNNKWIDVHISKLPFKKSEEILFKKFTDTLSYNKTN